MSRAAQDPVGVSILAVRETAGSALYGMVDVLCAGGNIWQTLTREDSGQALFRVGIVSPEPGLFQCGNGIPVLPDRSVADDPATDLVILPEIWLGPMDHLQGRYPAVMDWIRRCYRRGSTIYSACSGAVLLAETGLLDGRAATSHWAYRDLFARAYPAVRFESGPNLVFGDAEARIVTAGGATSWHDLVLHIIARHASPGEALRIASVYLLKLHAEGQSPYTPLTQRILHADAAVRRCQDWLDVHFRDAHAVRATVAMSGLPERTLKRRFRNATGTALIDYVQNLRVEAAKRLLETSSEAVEGVSERVGYEDASFFRRLFKRRTGLTPAAYRRLFQSVAHAGRTPGQMDAA